MKYQGRQSGLTSGFRHLFLSAVAGATLFSSTIGYAPSAYADNSSNSSTAAIPVSSSPSSSTMTIASDTTTTSSEPVDVSVAPSQTLWKQKAYTDAKKTSARNVYVNATDKITHTIVPGDTASGIIELYGAGVNKFTFSKDACTASPRSDSTHPLLDYNKMSECKLIPGREVYVLKRTLTIDNSSVIDTTSTGDIGDALQGGADNQSVPVQSIPASNGTVSSGADSSSETATTSGSDDSASGSDLINGSSTTTPGAVSSTEMTFKQLTDYLTDDSIAERLLTDTSLIDEYQRILKTASIETTIIDTFMGHKGKHGWDQGELKKGIKRYTAVKDGVVTAYAKLETALDEIENCKTEGKELPYEADFDVGRRHNNAIVGLDARIVQYTNLLGKDNKKTREEKGKTAHKEWKKGRFYSEDVNTSLVVDDMFRVLVGPTRKKVLPLAAYVSLADNMTPQIAIPDKKMVWVIPDTSNLNLRYIKGIDNWGELVLGDEVTFGKNGKEIPTWKKEKTQNKDKKKGTPISKSETKATAKKTSFIFEEVVKSGRKVDLRAPRERKIGSHIGGIVDASNGDPREKLLYGANKLMKVRINSYRGRHPYQRLAREAVGVLATGGLQTLVSGNVVASVVEAPLGGGSGNGTP